MNNHFSRLDAEASLYRLKDLVHSIWLAVGSDKYRAFYPVGTQARLAMEIMINVGARISDAVQIGPKSERKDPKGMMLSFMSHKNRNRFPTLIEVPMTKELAEAIANTKVGPTTYLASGKGKPYVIGTLGNKMRKWCDDAQLPECSSHGLRKAAAALLAENGATAPELCAVFGWRNLSTAQIYIRQAEKRKMARNAFERRA